MLSTLRNAWKTPEIRKKILWTFLLLVIYRFGNFILVSGVDPSKLSTATTTNSLLGFYDLMAGGAFSRCSIFAMGVMPYINASIIMQLLTIAIPYLEQLQKEGEHGRKKIQKYTRISSIVIGVIQSFGFYAIVSNFGALRDSSKFNMFLIILTFTTGSTFLMWLGEQITVKGIGNGVSLLIFINIISRFPTMVYNLYTMNQSGTLDVVTVAVIGVALVILFLSVVIANLAERRIPVQYAGKAVGNKNFRGQSSYIPININASAIIAIIFAMSLMQFPVIISSFWPKSWWYTAITAGKYSIFKSNSWQYVAAYFLFTVFFTWFYTLVTFKPDEMAENMNKASGFIPGIRPGEPTERYLENVLGKVSLLWGIFAGVIAVAPSVLELIMSSTNSFGFTGTGLLIMVGVATETMKAIQSQLVMRHYEGFLSDN